MAHAASQKTAVMAVDILRPKIEITAKRRF